MRRPGARARWVGYAAAGGVTVALMWQVAQTPAAQPVVAAVARPQGRAPLPAEAGLALPTRAAAAPPRVDPFGPLDAATGRPDARTTPAAGAGTALAAEPVVPTAPAAPFAYVGRWVEAGVESAILDRGGQTLTVRKGDVVDGSWRVDAVDDRQVLLDALPAHTTLTLPLRDMGGAPSANAPSTSSNPGSTSSGSADATD